MTTPAKEKIQTKARPLVDPTSTFIKKTYELLEDKKFLDIVDWNQEGTAIVIKKPLEFSQKVLPSYFKHNNITSFVRQLNMYNFHKRRTQDYDHVYYHDLFKRGKKHMLKEIKRKNQDNALAHIQKAIENLEAMQNGQKSETPVGSYENQLLKRLNKDAFVRISSLENKVKDLTIQNQALWNQIAHQNQKEDLLVSFMANFMKTKGISLDQLPKVLSNQFNLPLLNLDSETSQAVRNIGDQIKCKTNCSVADFLNFREESCNSTEVSPSSPFSKSQTNSDWKLRIPENNLESETPELKYLQPHGSDSSFNDIICNTGNCFTQPQNQQVFNWNLESNYINTLAKTDEKAHPEALNRRIADESDLLTKRGFDFENDSYKGFDKCQKKQLLNNPFFHLSGKMRDESDDFLNLNKLDSFQNSFFGIEDLNSSNFDLTHFN